MKWILSVWYNCGEDIMLDQAKFIETDPVCKYSKLNVITCSLDKALAVWLVGCTMDQR